MIEVDDLGCDCRPVGHESGSAKALERGAVRSLREYTERTFCMAQAYYQPYRDESGTPVSKRVTMTQSVRIETLKD